MTGDGDGKRNSETAGRHPFYHVASAHYNVIFIIGSMRNLFRIKKGWRGFLPAVAAAFLASGTVVYIGDWGNLPLTFVLLLILIWVYSEDDGWKKMTVGLLFGSTVFAWNAIVDNFIRVHSDYFLAPRVLFAVLFFAATRRFAEGKEYDLAPKMWRLVLLLTLVPVGNVLSVVLLSEERWEIGEQICGCILPCSACPLWLLWDCSGRSGC